MKAIQLQVKQITFPYAGNLDKFVFAQAYHETGGFTSNIFKMNNNMFGMKYPTKRPTTAIGQLNGYALYNNTTDSIRDLLLWFHQFGTIPNFQTVEEYATYLKEKGYYEDSLQNYIAGMNNALKFIV